MPKDNTLDMTEGNPVRHILIFALPMLVGNIFQQVYNLVDSVIVGKYVGADALAAIGATSSITFFFFALCNGVGSGGGIITSQYFGAHEDDKVKNCIVNTGFIMLVFPLTVGLLACFLARPILLLLNTPLDIMKEAVGYTQVMCAGLIFVSIYNFVSSMLRALGDSKTPLYFLIVASVINVILDLLFVCVFMMGVLGAGLATILAQIIAAAACFLYAFKKNPYFKIDKKDIKLNRYMIWSVVRLGVPLSLQFSLIAISSMAVQRVVNSFGTVAVAAYTATGRIEQLIHQPYQSLGSSLSTYCGQNYGAGKHNRVLDGYRKSLVIMAICTLGMVVVMQFLGETITSMFVSDIDVIKMGGLGLKITSIFYIFLGLIYVVRGVLNGVGDAVFALINGIVEVIGRFTVPILMTAYMGFGVMGIWWSCGVVWLLSGGTAWIRYLKYYKYAKANS